MVLGTDGGDAEIRPSHTPARNHHPAIGADLRVRPFHIPAPNHHPAVGAYLCARPFHIPAHDHHPAVGADAEVRPYTSRRRCRAGPSAAVVPRTDGGDAEIRPFHIPAPNRHPAVGAGLCARPFHIPARNRDPAVGADLCVRPYPSRTVLRQPFSRRAHPRQRSCVLAPSVRRSSLKPDAEMLH